MSPRVSIIVRTKDRPLFLRRALNDISAQTFSDVEIIVVNDGGNRAEVDEIVQISPWHEITQTLHNPSSTGMEHASNQGIEKSSGEFISIHDDDDTWDPAFLETCVDYLEKHPQDGATGVRTEIVWERLENQQIIYEGRQIAWPEIRTITFASLLRQNQAVPISCLYRASVIAELGGFRKDLPVVGDWEFHLRLSRKYGFGFVEGKPLAFWHQRRNQNGPAGNSVNAAALAHSQYDAKVRGEYLSDGLSDEEIGKLLIQGSEMQFLRNELAQILELCKHQQEELAKIREIKEQLDSSKAELETALRVIREQNSWLLHKADRASVFALLRSKTRSLKDRFRRK